MFIDCSKNLEHCYQYFGKILNIYEIDGEKIIFEIENFELVCFDDTLNSFIVKSKETNIFLDFKELLNKQPLVSLIRNGKIYLQPRYYHKRFGLF